MSFKQRRILMKTFVESQFEVIEVYEFQTKLNSYENTCWVSVWSCLSFKFETKSNFYEDICWASISSYVRLWVSNLRNSYEDISWSSVWSYVSWWVWNKSEFLLRHLLSLSLKLPKFTSFKEKRILMKTFVESHFEVMSVYQFQTKVNSYEDVCWPSVWSDVSLWISNKSEFLWRHLLSLSLKLCKFISFKQNRILMQTFVESQFEVM